ncbi:hypothetical protein LZ30DRAFT_744545 [Colletotrichum cereale]|nr:hypothetical protein LZ30DRAFT_744545 [Colletotrichum cereale]
MCSVYGKKNSPQPLTHVALTSEHRKPLPTHTRDSTPSESIALVESSILRTQASETPNDHNYGYILSEMPSFLPRGRESYNDAKSQSTPETFGNRSGLTMNETSANSHRKSKTEFNMIPAEVIPVGLDMARLPDADSQARERSSTEFAKTTAPGNLVEQPHIRDQVTTLPPVVSKPRPALDKRQDSGGRKVDSQLWQKPKAHGSAQQLWR